MIKVSIQSAKDSSPGVPINEMVRDATSDEKTAISGWIEATKLGTLKWQDSADYDAKAGRSLIAVVGNLGLILFEGYRLEENWSELSPSNPFPQLHVRIGSRTRIYTGEEIGQFFQQALEAKLDTDLGDSLAQDAMAFLQSQETSPHGRSFGATGDVAQMLASLGFLGVGLTIDLQELLGLE